MNGNGALERRAAIPRCRMGASIPCNKGLRTVHSVWEHPFSMQMMERVHHLYSHGCLHHGTALHFGNIKLQTTNSLGPGFSNLQFFLAGEWKRLLMVR